MNKEPSILDDSLCYCVPSALDVDHIDPFGQIEKIETHFSLAHNIL